MSMPALHGHAGTGHPRVQGVRVWWLLGGLACVFRCGADGRLLKGGGGHVKLATIWRRGTGGGRGLKRECGITFGDVGA